MRPAADPAPLVVAASRNVVTPSLGHADEDAAGSGPSATRQLRRRRAVRPARRACSPAGSGGRAVTAAPAPTPRLEALEAKL